MCIRDRLYSDKEYSLSFDILVPKLILKPLMKGKIVSGYLYDYGGFSGLSDKALEQLDYINSVSYTHLNIF